MNLLFSAKWGASLPVLAAGIFVAAPAAAQSQQPANAQAEAVKDIVVTASKFGSNLDRAPVAVSALSSAELERSNITTFKEAQIRIPSLVYNDQSLFAQAYIRGIGTSVVLSGLEPAIATYIDGVYLQRASGAVQDALDLKALQVFKGPQGTLYGRNATGGAIVIETGKPLLHKTEGSVLLEVGNFKTVRGQAVVNLPVSDTLAVRIAAQDTYRGGYGRDTVNGGRTYGISNQTIRGKLLWQPTPDFTAIYAIEYSNRVLRNPGQHQRLTAPACLACGIYGVTPTTGFYDSTMSGKPLDTVEWTAHTLDLTLTAGAFTIRNIASRRYQTLKNLQNNQSVADSSLFYSDVTEKGPTFTEDFYARSDFGGPLNLLVGASYERDRATLETILRGDAFAGVGGRLFNFNKVALDSYSIYGDLYYELAPGLKLTAGARYNVDKKRIQGMNDAPAALAFGVADFSNRKTFKETTPHAVISYESGSGYYYASFGRGARSGGFSTPAFGLPAALNSEQLDNYEIGAKNKFFDNRVSTNLAIFYGRYSDIQVLRVDPIRGIVAENAAKAELYGFEADVSVAVSDALHLSFGGAYVHNNFTSYPNAAIYALGPDGTIIAATADLSDTPLPRSPRFSGYVAVDHMFNLANSWSLRPSAVVRYTSRYDFFAGAGGSLGLDKQKAMALVNGSIMLTDPSEQFSIGLFGSNLTNEKYFDYAATNTFGAYYNPALPRTYGIRVTQKW